MKKVSAALCGFGAALSLWMVFSDGPVKETPALRTSASPPPADGISPSAPASSSGSAADLKTPENLSALGTAAAASVADSPIPRMEAVYAFQEFSKRWTAADPAGREAMREEGVRLAQARRPEFKKLIVADPRRALEEAVPRVVRQDMPADMVAALEKPVSDTGSYRVYLGRPEAGQTVAEGQLSLRYFETVNGASYKAHVFGGMEPVMSKEDVPLRGVAVDREMAVAESPVRRLETGERIAAEAKVEALCPVSGKTTEEVAPEEPVDEETPAVEIGSRVILLCNGSHVTVLDEQYKNLLQASGPGGSGYFFSNYPGDSSEALGNFRCLYVRITYPDQLKAPNTEDSAYGDMRNVSRFYLENSYGKLTTTSTVTPLIVMPHTQAWYIAKDDEVDGLGLLHSDARAEARKLGYDSRQFNCTIVRVNGGPRLSGVSWGGGDSVWVSWDGMDVLNHECGHSLGRNHANYWKTTDGTAYGEGANSEYGNPFDVMGGGGGFGAHYNTISKRALGWLTDAYVHKPAANGVYRIFAYDQPQLQEGQRYAFRVAKDSARTYYIEYHPANGNLTDSAVVMYSWSGMSNAGHLLDTTPGSLGGKNDGGIQIGRTYSDPEADMHFTVVSKNATQPPSLDLAYEHGPFPGNQPPVVNLTASATTIAAGASVTFTANATDPDGDTLAYHWDFNDGVEVTNTPVFTRTFASADQMTVMLTVSDMKGGSTRQHVLMNVGSHGRRTITGKILADGQPLANVLISDGSKYCYTDNAGDYILSDLTTGSHTLTATLAGHTFTPGFTNPLNVTAGTNTGNWTAAAGTFVSLTKTSDAAEGGVNGVLTLTRTGSTTAALTVRVATVGGTAAYTADYTFSPNYVTDGLFKTFTIPAGAVSLPVTVTAVNDASQEGPETITLSLVSNGSYFAGGQNFALMTLEDDDSTLPKVSVLPTGPYAMEFPAKAGEFTFSRTGPVTEALTVTVTYSGTAGKGADYTELPASVTFPAGQASTTLSVSPVNDTAIETPEECIVTLGSGATYLRDSTAQAATVVIADDDTPSVTVTAMDATAAEAGREPGTFLITRTGSTAASLRVFYGLSGSALPGTDYIALTGEITIPAGSASAPVTVTPYDDDLGEPEDQSVVLSLTTFNNAYSLGAAYSATVSIRDNDDQPVVSVRAGTTPAEPSTAGTFLFRAIGSATGNVSVKYTVSGTATAGTDYTALSGTVSVPANGSNDVTVNIPVRNDTVAEPTETIIVTITPDTAYKVYNDGTATARLKDDERSVPVMVSTWNTAPAEGGAAGRFYISRPTTSTTGSLTVSYTMSGTAVNGTDYTTLSGTALIPIGEPGVDVTVTPVNDTLVEGTETVTLTLSPGTSYGVEEPGSATLYLADNETPPVTARFAAATGTTSEAPNAVTGEFRDIAVQISPASTSEVTVEYTGGGGTAAGDDTDWAFADAAAGNAVISKGILTFPAGTTTQNIRVRVKNDGVVEGDETALITLQNSRFARVSSSAGTHTLTIQDANNPVRRVRFLLASSTRSETEAGEPMLMAVLDRAAEASPVTRVNYTVGGTATQGADFNLAPGTLTFTAGQSFQMLPLTILPDSETESPETVVITLKDPVNAELGGISTFTLNIRESTVPALNIAANDAAVAENAGPAVFTITRGGTATTLPLTGDFTISGTAVAGTDFTAPASGSFTIPAGADSTAVSIPLLNDDAEDGGKTLILTLNPGPAYELGLTTQAIITIQDDDAPPSVAILEPLAKSAAIPSGVGLMLRAEGTAVTPQGISTVPTAWSMVSGPGSAAFEEDSGRTAVKFTANGDYVLRATATDGTRSGFTDLHVRVGAVRTAVDIGTTTAAGSWSESDAADGSGLGGKITVSGAGSGISTSGTSDGFYFLAAPVTGNFDVKCRVLSLDNPGSSNSCRAGLIVRATVAANAPYAMMLHKADFNTAFHARLTAGADPYDSTGTTPDTLPGWIRLVRAGNAFSAYSSPDGSIWTQRGTTQTIAGIGTSPLLGFAVTSAAAATASTAVYDSYTGFLPTNIGPLVNAGPALSGAGPWNLDATVTDDGMPAPAALTTLWRQMDGTGPVSFTTSSAIDTGVSFLASGTYRLRLSAADGGMTTFAETSAAVSAMSPLLAWRQAHFGSTADTGEAANGADSDQDGLANILEYALGTKPKTATAPPLEMSAEGGQWTLRFPRQSGSGQVILTLQSSTDLVEWAAAARSENGNATVSIDLEATATETAGADGSVAVKVSLPGAITQSPKRYFRLLAEPATLSP
ncbi:MAG: Calx-beta domain-containing protein [Verrucomicrobiota bacterium]